MHMTKAKFLIFLSFSEANGWYEPVISDLNMATRRLIAVYGSDPPNLALQNCPPSLIIARLEDKSLIANDELQAKFQEAIKEAETLLRTTEQMRQDINNASYPDYCQKSQGKPPKEILCNYTWLIDSPGGNQEDDPRSKDFLLLQKILKYMPRELQPLIKRAEDAMKQSIELRQKCVQLEEALQKAHKFHFLKEAIGLHEFPVYSKEDLLKVEQRTDEFIKHFPNSTAPLLKHHLNNLVIEENPVLSKIVDLCRDILYGDIFQKYREIAIHFQFHPFVAYDIYRNIDFRRKKILEKITKYYTALHEQSPEPYDVEDLKRRFRTCVNEVEMYIAEDLRQFERLESMMGDNKNGVGELYKRQRNALKELVENVQKNRGWGWEHQIELTDKELCDELLKEARNVIDKISCFIEEASEDLCDEHLCDELLKEAKDMFKKISETPEDCLNEELRSIKDNLRHLANKAYTEKELSDLSKEIDHNIVGERKILFTTPFALLAEFTSLPEHDIVLEDDVLKFRIKRNTELEKRLDKVTNCALIHQKNYLMAITHDSSFQEKNEDFVFQTALENLEANVRTYKGDVDEKSQPEWIKTLSEDIKNMRKTLKT